MPSTKMTGVKMPVDLREAIEGAAKFYGVKMSPLILQWLHDRAAAEGWLAKVQAEKEKANVSKTNGEPRKSAAAA
jgi:hypothetical protein